MKPESAARDRAVLRILWVILGLNAAVAATKLAVGYHIGALSLVADGLHSVLDASANVVGIVGIAYASRPADAGHPYGHRRFETLAAAAIGLLVGAGFVELFKAVLAGYAGEGSAPQVGGAAVATVGVTIMANMAISRYESRAGARYRSAILEADSKHTLSDALAASVVLVGFLGVYLGFPWADLAAATVVSGFVAYTAWTLLRDNLAVLSDTAQLDVASVHRVAVDVPGVLGAHNIRSRGSRDSVALDLHIHVAPTLSVAEAHKKTHDVIDALRAHFPEVWDVVIHTEPADGREKDYSRLAPGHSERPEEREVQNTSS